jgi:hypothetical protein
VGGLLTSVAFIDLQDIGDRWMTKGELKVDPQNVGDQKKIEDIGIILRSHPVLAVDEEEIASLMMIIRMIVGETIAEVIALQIPNEEATIIRRLVRLPEEEATRPIGGGDMMSREIYTGDDQDALRCHKKFVEEEGEGNGVAFVIVVIRRIHRDLCLW